MVKEAMYRRHTSKEECEQRNEARVGGAMQKNEKVIKRKNEGFMDGCSYKVLVVQEQAPFDKKGGEIKVNHIGKDAKNRAMEKIIVVNGVMNEEILEKLNRSIPGETLYPVNIDVLVE